jgi:hypothetical protein
VHIIIIQLCHFIRVYVSFALETSEAQSCISTSPSEPEAKLGLEAR